ncbi:MAG TPA: hypothetical protein PKA03_11530 [Tabrizicola sp.]|nr:hypothetical protein [Tabrizicola sp.]
MTTTGRLPAAIVLILAIAFAVSPALMPEFGGYDPTQFPLLVARPAILPSGYAFAIWGAIYLWLVLHGLYGLLLRPDDPTWGATRPALGGSLAVGTIWLAVAIRSPVLASVLIAVMLLLTLTALFKAPARPDRWLLLAPLAIFAGWLTAATGVSIGILLSGYGWLPDPTAAILMLGIVLGAAIVVQTRLRNAPEYALTVIWALVAILVANGQDNLTVSTLAAGAILILALVAFKVASQR